jgi:hypothetical protein
MESVKVFVEGVASVFGGMASTPWTTALSVAAVVALLALIAEFVE